MPNWCNTTYRITGEKSEVNRLLEILEACESSRIKEDPMKFGKMWLGHIVEKLGGDAKEVYCRGEVEEFYMSGENLLHVNVTSAWSEPSEFRKFIKEQLPSLLVIYLAEEPDMEYYVTNDRKGLFFRVRYWTWHEIDGREEFNTLSDMLSYLNRIYGREFTSFEEAYEFSCNKDELSLGKYEIIDD